MTDLEIIYAEIRKAEVPIRRALGIGQYDHLTPSQIEMAKSAAIAQEMTDAQG